LREQTPDVALAMMTHSNVLMALASVGLRDIRTVGAERVHPALAPLGSAWSMLRFFGYGLLDVIVAQTAITRSWLLSHTDARNVAVVPNPVVWPLERVAPTVNPESIGDSGRRRLLAVGRLVHQKGFDILIEVFAQLATQFPDWELVIIGRGEDGAALQSRIDSHSLAGRVFLAGDVGNMGDWYEAADVFVLSSRFEGFPNALGEAMAYGLPVVSFDCDTGPRDLIENEVNGLLVPDGDAAALGRALARTMSDEGFRTRVAGRAVSVRERYSLGTVGNTWLDLFRSLTVRR
jgi:glycosyltransferase involved in cell wall biosynthesis